MTKIIKNISAYFIPLIVISGWTVFIKLVFPHIELVNLVMTYLLANVLIAVRYGQGPSLISAVLSVALFNFFFVPPYLTFAVADVKYLITFAIMFIVTILTSRLMFQLKQKAQEVRVAERAAERESLISMLLSSVSHDLRTPLTSISGAASTLLAPESKLSSQDRTHLLETINDESGRLNRLVENILQITKIESGNVTLRKEMNSLEEIIGSCLNRLEPFLGGRKITTDIPEDLPLIPLDGILIEQVLVNLFENALRYTPAGSPIDVKAFQDAKQVCVEVLDRGRGIPQKEQSRIFEKFYRSGKHDVLGSGLGLAICEGILKAHEGKIGVRDREGGGSVFYFSLPL